ncbi:MAG TPA: 5-(carboxyamino)imidazole ribonucleotide synthase [Mycobacteriales bacterium]|nr:5-(carboxyamino)imidazole ribonucleotide synthase [Mycobacteriales bacterium]
MTAKATGLPVVGMVGGGQLARMTHQAAISLGLTLRVLADNPDDGAALVTPDVELGAATDAAAVERFAKACDVVTFDHEHVPNELIASLAASGVAMRPGAGALRYAQDKRAMRQRLGELGVPIPRWSDDATSLPRPFVAKAARGGYDGRGVWIVNEGDPLPQGDVIVEEKVTIVHELAVQVARTPSGRTKCWPVVETVQDDGICVEVVAPAPRLSHALTAEAQALAVRIAEELDVVGVLAVELFEAPSGLLVNELAMRPHNSAHWTIEGSRTSQFEQHLRAVLDYPLGSTEPAAPAVVMVNLLGADGDITPKGLDERVHHFMARWPDVKLHLYGKAWRPGRKVGHVTALGPDLAVARARAQTAADYLMNGDVT